jgi:hypothetical protein
MMHNNAQQCTTMNNNYNGSVTIGTQIDNSNNKGQINIAEEQATINATQAVDKRSLTGIDMEKLKKELIALKEGLKKEDFLVEAMEISKAIEAKEELQIIGFLKAAGKKSLEIAETYALPIAVDTIKKAIGLG